MVDRLQSTDFSPYLNDEFRIRTSSDDFLEIELLEVTEIGSPPPEDRNTPKRRPFSVVFRGPMDAPIPQDIYEIEHEKMGAFSIFIVPIGPDGEGLRYEAVFA